MWTFRITGFILGTACLILAGPGSAVAKTTVSVRIDDRFGISELELQGGPGQDEVTVTEDGDRFTIDSYEGVVAGENCQQTLPSSVSCAGASPYFAPLLSADMSSGDDRLDVAAKVFRSTIHGGRGDDRLKARHPSGRFYPPGRIFGGTGSDALIGSGGKDVLRGGRGGDNLIGRDGGDRLIGGLGRDLMQGDAGEDRLHAEDGIADRAAICGSGSDRVVLDRLDPNPSADCETVRSRLDLREDRR